MPLSTIFQFELYIVAVSLIGGGNRSTRRKPPRVQYIMGSIPEDYKIGICCFSTKHAALRRKSKDWLARNQDNMSEWGDMSIR